MSRSPTRVAVAEGEVDGGGERLVFGRVGGVVVVEVHMEGGEVADVGGAHAADEFLRGDAFGLGAEHDGRAVGVVGADVAAFAPAHFVEARPDSAWMYPSRWPRWMSPLRRAARW